MKPKRCSNSKDRRSRPQRCSRTEDRRKGKDGPTARADETTRRRGTGRD